MRGFASLKSAARNNSCQDKAECKPAAHTYQYLDASMMVGRIGAIG
jgi:hypothetical protein